MIPIYLVLFNFTVLKGSVEPNNTDFPYLLQIPVNRFLYWEMSKLVFYGIVFCTLMDEDDVAW